MIIIPKMRLTGLYCLCNYCTSFGCTGVQEKAQGLANITAAREFLRISKLDCVGLVDIAFFSLNVFFSLFEPALHICDSSGVKF